MDRSRYLEKRRGTLTNLKRRAAGNRKREGKKKDKGKSVWLQLLYKKRDSQDGKGGGGFKPRMRLKEEKKITEGKGKGSEGGGLGGRKRGGKVTGDAMGWKGVKKREKGDLEEKKKVVGGGLIWVVPLRGRKGPSHFFVWETGGGNTANLFQKRKRKWKKEGI